ncbi:MAG: M20/M25/M40 family metallo-hydrolase [Acidimicrobiia bacterium]|nr:M20/M25/M40 family metallo-hydrolase [Acidimicrobiia bacterium]
MKHIFLAVLCTGLCWADSAAGAAARKWRQQHERAILDEYVKLLSLPNVASNVDDMRRNAVLIRAMLEKRKISTQLLEIPGAPPVIFGERKTPGATRTVVFYVHYDGQPVAPEMWFNKNPFQPTMLDAPLEAGGKPTALPATGPIPPEWRLYARSTGDDKAPVITLTSALDAVDAAGIAPTSNLKFFFDGEEEAGSPHMGQFLEKYNHLLAADVWIFCDGPVHQSRRQKVVFGVRGATALEVTVYGPRRELHSGHYGNWAPNPAMMLAQLLASMKDEEGKVLVKDFYRDMEPLGEAERKALAEAPNFDAEIKKELWLNRTEGDGLRLDELITRPALNIQGISSAHVGAQARNVVPAEATAHLGIRLVKGTDARIMQDLVIAHIKSRGYHVVETEPGPEVLMKHPRVCKVLRRSGYNAVRAPMDLPISRAIVAAMEAARGPVIKLPTSGGSLPIAPIQDVMRTPVIMIPIANHDNNQHAHNENMRIQNLWDGIETMAALLAMK